MRLIRGLAGLSLWQHNSAVTIGNFDGIHRGHQQMLARLCNKAKQLGVPSVLISFEPLPHEFFTSLNQDKTPIRVMARLMGLRQKLEYLSANTDLDAVLCLPFNQVLSELPAEQFANDILLAGLSAKYVLLGDDFRFGHQRQGDFKLLQQLSVNADFVVESMASVEVDGTRVSSSRVREALIAGDLLQASNLLGRPYRLSGRIVKGDELGRTLGYPTANIHLRHQAALAGVFAVLVQGLDKSAHLGMANIGFRPTVNGRDYRFEVNLLDFDEDIYGRYVEVDIIAKLRDEQRFDCLADLKAQLLVDERAARDYFAQQADG